MEKKVKIAIIYTTTGGTTRECGELLLRELAGQDVTLVDMEASHSLADYDMAVVGFPIRMGKPSKKARRYIKEHKDELLAIKAAYYMCCGFIDCAEEYAEKVLPRDLKERALDITCLGGSLDPLRFKGFDRFIVKAVRSEILGGGNNGEGRDDMSLPTILDENISQLADLIKNSN